MNRIGAWIQDRTGLGTFGRAVFLRHVPLGVGVLYTLGFATAFVFALQIATGIVLAFYYAPTPDHAYDSVAYITNDLAFGRIVRGLHHWGSSAMVVLVGTNVGAGNAARAKRVAWTGCAVAASISRTFPSKPVEATVRLSGAKATTDTPWTWPRTAARSWPVVRSNSRTVLSSPPEASVLPSGLKAMVLSP